VEVLEAEAEWDMRKAGLRCRAIRCSSDMDREEMVESRRHEFEKCGSITSLKRWHFYGN